MPPLNNKPLPRTALEPVCEALAEVIRQRREASGLSLNRLAELTRLSRQMISFIETNRCIPTIDTTARISRAFGILFNKFVIEAENRLQPYFHKPPKSKFSPLSKTSPSNATNFCFRKSEIFSNGEWRVRMKRL